MSTRVAGIKLAACLWLLAGLYLAWLVDGRHAAAVLLVFVVPPLLLGLASLRGGRLAGYWSSVCALGWFSHGVMRAWTDASVLPPLTAIALSLAIIAAGSGPAARARLAARRQARQTATAHDRT